jgi:hypothetical protein
VALLTSDLLVATGLTPNTDGIGLEIAGVALDGRGYITVNERLCLGAQAHHLASRVLRSSFTQRLLRLLRCSAPTHDLAHLDTNSLAANRGIRA